MTKETLYQSANSESFGAKMRDTPICFPILTILYLVSNCSTILYLVLTIDSFVLKRDWGSPCWPWLNRMVSKIPQMLILSILNCKWHSSVKSASESENMSTHFWIFSVYPINVRRTQNGKCDPDGRTYVDQVSPPTWLWQIAHGAICFWT